MKYYKSTNFSKIIASSGFIAMIACLLLALGAIGWFTLSNNKNVSEKESSQQQESYFNDISSYNSEIETPIAEEQNSEDVNESVDDIPYTESSTTIEQEVEKPTFVLPVTGNVSKGFSDSALQYSATYDDMRLHTGVDILCEIGSNIKSVGSGTVKSIVDDANFGKVVTIIYGENIVVKYCGLGSVTVKENDKVMTGDIIGTSGDIPSECADNPHIHIEVIVDDIPVSPFSALGLE